MIYKNNNLEVEYRNLVESDFDRVNELLDEIYRTHLKLRNDLYKRTKDRFFHYTYEEYMDRILDKEYINIGAYINNKLVGMCLGYYRHFGELNCSSYISDLVTDKKIRGRGVGKGLIKKLEMLSKDMGSKRVELEVLASNTEAKKLYDNSGYTIQKYRMEKKI